MAAKVAVIGAGSMGTAVGQRLVKAGRQVTYGTRSIEATKIQDLLKAQHGAKADTVHNAVAWADVVILTVPGANSDAGIHEAAASLGPGIKGKVLVDACNPLTAFPALEVRHGQVKSGGEVLAEALPDTVVVKALNTISAGLLNHMSSGSTLTEAVQVLVAGPDDRKDVVDSVIRDIGLEPVHVGPIRYARNLEAIAELVIHLIVPPAGFTTVDLGPNCYVNLVPHIGKASS